MQVTIIGHGRRWGPFVFLNAIVIDTILTIAPYHKDKLVHVTCKTGAISLSQGRSQLLHSPIDIWWFKKLLHYYSKLDNALLTTISFEYAWIRIISERVQIYTQWWRAVSDLNGQVSLETETLLIGKLRNLSIVHFLVNEQSLIKGIAIPPAE